MPSKTEDLTEELPTDIDPYKVLDLDEKATENEIKIAYRKAALKNHPDKVPATEKEAAHTKFQAIAFAYAILSDARRRARYDATGRTEESLDLDDDDAFNWTDFFRAQFKDVVTPTKIEEFAQEYKGGAEERETLLAAYEQGKGAMHVVYQKVLLSNPAEDEERFRKILDEEIEAGRVEGYKKYTGESEKSIKARINRSKREAKEADESAKELKGKKAEGGGDISSLAALIQNRQKGRQGNFLADLEAKYAPKKSKKGRKRAEVDDDEPPEEAFQATAARAKRAKR